MWISQPRKAHHRRGHYYVALPFDTWSMLAWLSMQRRNWLTWR